MGKVCDWCALRGKKGGKGRGNKGCPEFDFSDDMEQALFRINACDSFKFSEFLKPVSFMAMEDGILIDEVVDAEGQEKFAIYDPKSDKVRYALVYPPKPNAKFRPVCDGDRSIAVGERIINYAVHFPTHAEEYGTLEELLDDMFTFFYKWVDIPDLDMRIHIMNAAFTWIHDKFQSLSISRFLGEFGSGKTRAGHTLGLMCYKPALLLRPTPPNMWRIRSIFHSTIVITEGDLRKGSEHYNQTVQFYNGSVMRGEVILRLEAIKGTGLASSGYDAYGPMILGTRENFTDMAFESRCVTTRMRPTQRDDIPSQQTPDFYATALGIRNKLLMFRFRNYHDADYTKLGDIDLELKQENISRRLLQVVTPIFSVCKTDAQREMLKGFIRKYDVQLKEKRRDTIEGTVAGCIADLIDSGAKTIFTDELYENVQVILNDPMLRYTKQKLGNMLTLMNISRKRSRFGKGPKRLHITTEIPELLRICKHYGVDTSGLIGLIGLTPTGKGEEEDEDNNKDTSILEILTLRKDRVPRSIQPSQPSQPISEEEARIIRGNKRAKEREEERARAKRYLSKKAYEQWCVDDFQMRLKAAYGALWDVIMKKEE